MPNNMPSQRFSSQTSKMCLGQENHSKGHVVCTGLPSMMGGNQYLLRLQLIYFSAHKKGTLTKPNEGFIFTVKDYLNLWKLFFILRQQMDFLEGGK